MTLITFIAPENHFLRPTFIAYGPFYGHNFGDIHQQPMGLTGNREDSSFHPASVQVDATKADSPIPLLSTR